MNTGNYKTGAQLSRLGSYYAQLVKDTVGGELSLIHILVKGSRGMRTDEIVAALTAGQEA